MKSLFALSYALLVSAPALAQAGQPVADPPIDLNRPYCEEMAGKQPLAITQDCTACLKMIANQKDKTLRRVPQPASKVSYILLDLR